jgi:hypothetical protein
MFKRNILCATILVFGFLCGVLSTCYMMKKLRPTYVGVIRSGIQVEQAIAAANSAREKRWLESAMHRWLAANVESEQGFLIFHKDQNFYTDNSLFYPFSLLAVQKIEAMESIKKGRKIVEGINRGKLAVAFEKLGENILAEQEWERARALTNRKTIQETKEMVSRLLEYENSGEFIVIEELFLKRSAQSENQADER